MMQNALEQGFKVAFYLISGAILSTFFILTFIEGLMAQTASYTLSAIILYFIAMCSLGTAYWTYNKARKVLKTLN